MNTTEDLSTIGHTGLKKSLNAFHLWGLCVGLVISGEYFGWSYGWAHAGTLGFLITTILVAVMYISFILSFTELSASIPNSGGPFAYAYKGFGEKMAFVAGFATLIEFVFAPPAIALAIGAYMNVQFPFLSASVVACLVYLIFMLLNALGVSIAATFELVITSLAVFELLVFMGVVAPGFSFSNFLNHGWAGNSSFDGWKTIMGIFAAIPFGIWFFLGIEGASMVSEEVKNPQKTIPKAFLLGIFTLVLLSFSVMLFAGSVGNWQELANINDPLPQAMIKVVGNSSGWIHMLVFLGLFGLVASFHGLMIGYSRQIYALARARYLPHFLAKLSYRFKTPYLATLAGGLMGLLAIFSDRIISIGNQPLTANIVTLSVLGALTMYIISICSLFKIRKKYPNLYRPYKTPLYPILPIIALSLASLFLITLILNNLFLSLIYIVLLVLSYCFRLLHRKFQQ